MNPVADSLVIEGSSSAYANILAVKEGNETSPKVLALIAALESQQVVDYINEKYDGSVVSTVENPTDGFEAPDDFRRLPLYIPRHPLIANRLAGWLGFPFDELRICGTYNLINNARRLARTGAVVLGLDVPGLLDASDDVRFVALEPELLTDALLVWPNGRRQNAVEAAFLEALRDEFSAADA